MGKEELEWAVRAREVEEKALKPTPPLEGLSLLLRASTREGITSKSPGFPQATPRGEVLPFLSCRETSVGCAAGCRHLPHQLPAGEDLVLDPSLGVLQGICCVSAAGKRMAGKAEAGEDEIQPCSSCSNYLCCQKNSRS